MPWFFKYKGAKNQVKSDINYWKDLERFAKWRKILEFWKEGNH